VSFPFAPCCELEKKESRCRKKEIPASLRGANPVRPFVMLMGKGEEGEGKPPCSIEREEKKKEGLTCLLFLKCSEGGK